MSYNFTTIIPKFDAILARGLSSGMGDKDGQMCVEAAVCAAMGLPHTDDPGCVAVTVRVFKIVLNDARWSSPQARAKGLRDLGIAQIGSLGIVNDVEFSSRLAIKVVNVLLPVLFNELGIACSPACEQVVTLDDAANAAADAAWYAPANAAANTANAARNAAANAAGDAAYAVAYAANAVAYAANAAKYGDKYLALAADLALQILKDLGSPGCAHV